MISLVAAADEPSTGMPAWGYIVAVVAALLTYAGGKYSDARKRDTDRETAQNSRDVALSDQTMKIIAELQETQSTQSKELSDLKAELKEARSELRRFYMRDLAWVTRDSSHTQTIVSLGGSPDPLPEVLK